MNRILALQVMTESPFDPLNIGDSNQSHQCSSSTGECSTQSAGCQPVTMAVAW